MSETPPDLYTEILRLREETKQSDDLANLRLEALIELQSIQRELLGVSNERLVVLNDILATLQEILQKIKKK